MDYQTQKKLAAWAKPYISSYALQHLLGKYGQAFHSAVKRFLKEGSLLRIRRGCYRIDERILNLFEIAQELHGPSFISFESALSYHGWIPEAVYTTTSACMRRTFELTTPVGVFSYNSIPIQDFYHGVERVAEEDVFLIASPWRALADLIYVQKKNWKGLNALCEDLRVEPVEVWDSDSKLLEDLVDNYPNIRVKKVLARILKTLKE